MAGCGSAFAENNPIALHDLINLCSDSEELRIFLLKSGLLGDRSGLCEICNKGGTFYWKCGANK